MQNPQSYAKKKKKKAGQEAILTDLQKAKALSIG